ncbi:MAG: hypothetical protein IJD04_08330 [Desulfovibrionaceae bacterium]|nr:hypothetical protein [Desulfovibrionaceae bacterium]
MRKLHFINRVDRGNTGDWTCSPLNYFFEYFNQFNLVRHDMEYIDWNNISRDDIVIIGASGMLYVAASVNQNINRCIEKCDTVIAWSVGFNTHNHLWYQGNNFEDIPFDQFKLISIRDFNHPSGLEYLPDPTCLAKEFDDIPPPDKKRAWSD